MAARAARCRNAALMLCKVGHAPRWREHHVTTARSHDQAALPLLSFGPAWLSALAPSNSCTSNSAAKPLGLMRPTLLNSKRDSTRCLTASLTSAVVLYSLLSD